MEEHGIDIKKLKPGTKVLVNTQHSVYDLTVTDDNHIIAQGGKHLPEPKKVMFHGSTWGGSMLKMNWIGHYMHMEMTIQPNHVLTTSAVTSAKIIGKDWEYELNWSPTQVCNA